MNDHEKPLQSDSVSIRLGDIEGKIEKLPLKEAQAEKIRISCWGNDKARPLPRNF